LFPPIKGFTGQLPVSQADAGIFERGGIGKMRFAQSFRPLRIFLLLFFGGILLAASAWGDSAKIVSAIDSASANGQAVSRKIHEWKEQGQEEFKSSALLMEELKKLGYTVTGDLKAPEDLVKGGILKTAFKAEMRGKGPVPPSRSCWNTTPWRMATPAVTT
jgi:hypothetical protein